MIPLIRLTVEHMKQEVLHAFQTRQTEYENALKSALDSAITEFDFEKCVNEIATTQLRAACEELTKEVVREVVWDLKFRAKLKASMVKKLRKTDL